MYLEERPKRRVDVVDLTYQSVKYPDWVLSSLHIQYFRAANRRINFPSVAQWIVYSLVKITTEFFGVQSRTHNHDFQWKHLITGLAFALSVILLTQSSSLLLHAFKAGHD